MKNVLLCIVLLLPCNSWCQAGWSFLNLISSAQRFEDAYFVDKNTGFAVDFAGSIQKTTDAGATWQVVYNAPDQFRSIEFLDDKMTGMAGSFSGTVVRTTDCGVTWTNISPAFPGYGTRPKSICGFAHYGNNFYGVGWWGADTARFFKSTDKGLTWTTKLMDTTLATNLVDAVFMSADTGFVTGGRNTLHVNNASNRATILKTTDGGNTWHTVFVDSTLGGRVWKIQALSSKVLVASIEPYYLDSVVMIKSVDGGNTWKKINTGFQSPTGIFAPTTVQGITQGIGFVTEKTGWLGGWYPGLFETQDSGKTWSYYLFSTNFNRFFIIDSLHAFAGALFMHKYLGDTTQHSAGIVAPQLRAPHLLYPVSPNPSKGNVKIEFDLKTETNVVLEVASIDTRHITRIVSARMKPGHYSYNWDGRNAPNGYYMVWLGTDEIPIVQKFELNR